MFGNYYHIFDSIKLTQLKISLTVVRTLCINARILILGKSKPYEELTHGKNSFVPSVVAQIFSLQYPPNLTALIRLLRTAFLFIIFIRRPLHYLTLKKWFRKESLNTFNEQEGTSTITRLTINPYFIMQGSDDKECKMLLLGGCRSAVGVTKYHFSHARRQQFPGLYHVWWWNAVKETSFHTSLLLL